MNSRSKAGARLQTRSRCREESPVGHPVDTVVDAEVDAEVDAPVDAPVDAKAAVPVDAPVDPEVGGKADVPGDAPIGSSPDRSIPDPEGVAAARILPDRPAVSLRATRSSVYRLRPPANGETRTAGRRRSYLRAVFLGIALAAALQAIQPRPGAAQANGSLWDDREGLRYTNRKAMRVGDLITVLVTESSKGSNRSSLKTKKNHEFTAEGGPGSGPLDFIPLFKLDSKLEDKLDGSGAVSVSGQLTTTITVEVREVRSNGHLVVEGTRLINLNGEEERVNLHGVARPEDVLSDNTILSTKLAEVKISYEGKGAGKSASRRGIFQRLLGWIF